MNALEVLAGLDWWSVAGWTMLHYLWLGLAVGAAAGASRFVLRRASAQLRYVVALGWLAALVVLPVGIGVGVGDRVSGVRESVGDRSADGSAKPQAAGRAVLEGMGTEIAATDEIPMDRGRLARSGSPLGTVLAIEPQPPANPTTDANPRQSRGLTGGFDVDAVTRDVAEWLPWVWIVGAPVTFLLLATGVVGAERLRRESRLVVDGPVVECLERLRASLSIGRRVAVAVCERVAAPVLVGVVRPMILLPPAALTGWSPEEIEMVLLHELAHVRRWDNLVNLLQRFVEAVLFFQPAVWLVSGWARREREACCDAVVVGRTKRPQAYAELLVEMAALMCQPSEPGRPRPWFGTFTRGRGRPGSLGSLVSAMAAGPLRGRIRRILGMEDDPMLVSGKSLSVVMSSLLLAATLVVLNLPTRSEAEQKADLTTEGTERDSASEDENLASQAIHAKFVPSDGNALETKHYIVADPERTRAKLDAISADLSVDTSEPRAVFLKVWSDEGTRFKVVAPRAGQQLIKSTIDEFNDGKWRSETTNNLKDLMLALLNYEAANGHLPPRAKFDANGKPLLSWRVLALPYLDPANAKLYEQFRLDEPWDSEHNKQLVARMPDVFRNPRIAQPGMTNYLAVVGTECVFDVDGKPVQMRQVSDGTANTIALVEADADRVVEWTKPDDWEFDREHPTAGLGGLWPDGWFAAWVDGSVHTVSNTKSAEQVGIQFTRAGGETKSLAESAGSVGSNMIAGMDDRSRYGAPREMMGGRGVAGMAGDELGGEMGRGADQATDVPVNKFPTLEEQKLADLVWKRLNGLELEPLNAEQLKKVKELGYEGGLRNSTNNASGLQQGDILVGLHVWPTTRLQDVVNVLNRDDLGELNPLKYYVVRDGQYGGAFVDTGRIEVKSGNPPASPSNDHPHHAGSQDHQLRALYLFTPRSALNQAIEPWVTAIETDYLGFIETKRINVDAEPALAKELMRQHGLDKLPAFLFFRDDNLVARIEGPFTESQLVEALNRVSEAVRSNRERHNRDVTPTPQDLAVVPTISNAMAPQANSPAQRLVPRVTPDGVVVYESVPTADQGTTYPVVPPSSATAYQALPVYTPGRAVPMLAPMVAPAAYPPATEEEISAVRKRGSIRIELYLDPKSEAGREAVAMIPKYEAALPQLVKIEQRDVAKDPKLAEEAGIGKTLPVFKLFYRMANGEVGLQTSVGVLSVDNLKSAIARVARQELWRGHAAVEASQPMSRAPSADRPGSNGNQESVPASPPVPEDVLRALRERGPLTVEVFYLDNSGPCREMRSIVQEFGRANLSLPVKIEMKNAEVHRAETAGHGITRVPTLVWRRDGEVVKKSNGASSVVDFANQLFTVARALPEKKPEKKADKPTLRYDGKTFDQWRTEWQTELSTEKRIEAVKALSAFGRAGYGKEAAATILDVAGEYDFTFLQQDDDPDGKFKQTVIEVLAPESGRPSMAEYWLPDLVARMKDDPRKWEPLAECVLGQLRTDNPQVIELLQSLAAKGAGEVQSAAVGALVRSDRVMKRNGPLSDETRQLLGAALASDDAGRVRFALPLMLYDPNNPWATMGHGLANPQLMYLPELMGPLASSDEGVRQQARLQLQYIQAKDAPALLEQLVKVLKDDSRDAEHVEAMRAIAAMGPAAVAATPELHKIVSESKDENAIVAALFASACVHGRNVALNLVHNNLDTGNLLEIASNAIHPLLTPDNPQVDALGKKLEEIDGLQRRLEQEAEAIFPASRARPGGGMF